MTLKLKGKPREEAERLLRNFQLLVTTDSEPDTKGLGDAVLLRGVRKFPQRVKCAMLAWRAFEQALGEGGSVTTEEPTT
jgi:nitrogen fixation protein NifU and related proteins